MTRKEKAQLLGDLAAVLLADPDCPRDVEEAWNKLADWVKRDDKTEPSTDG